MGQFLCGSVGHGSLPVTHCLLCRGGATSCTTGWVNYANEPSQAALERSSQDAYDVIMLTRSKAAVWTVDDVACVSSKVLK